MKKCSQCGAEFDARIEFCFRCGASLGKPLDLGTPKPVPHSLAGLSDPTDSMQTLDNINIDDLLQIGGHTSGFQGFGGFPPISEVQKPDQPTENSSSALDTFDFEMDEFEDDVDAHLEDTLDGVQVADILSSSLNFDDAQVEIQPGDTLDLIADELGLPETNETDLNKLSQQNMDEDLAAWEQSAPAIQEAVRQVQEHRERVDPPEQTFKEEKNRSNLGLVALTVLVLIGIFWLVSPSDSDNENSTETVEVQTPEVKPEQQVVKEETIKEIQPVENDDVKEEVEEQNDTVVEEPAVSTPEVVKPVEQKPVVATPKPKAPPKVKTTPPKATPKVVTKKVVPKKPKTTPKAIPQKPKAKPSEPVSAAASEWGSDAQTGGWGASNSCSVTIKSNIQTAKVFIDGKQKGKVGQSISLDCGTHIIKVKADGYEEATRNVNLSEDASFTMDLDR